MNLGKIFVCGVIALSPFAVAAEELQRPTLNLYGVPGLLDMPSAEHDEDGQLTTYVSRFGGNTRTSINFQILPRLSGTFRYSHIKDFDGAGVGRYDRSFDVRYLIFDESRYFPAVSLGLQDFIGTGLYSGEYIVATKHLHPTLKVSLGVGWGRYGSVRSNAKRDVDTGQGGTVQASNWFKGDVAVFGGLEWSTPVDGLNLKLEYSSDAYVAETVDRNLFERDSQLNIGVDYRVSDFLSLGAYYMYGTEFGISAAFTINPKNPPSQGSLDSAPVPVKVRQPNRGSAELYDTSWTKQTDGPAILKSNLETFLEAEGQTLESIQVSVDRVVVHFRNNRNEAVPQAIGRMARILTNIMPSSVETFVIVPVVEGMSASAITLRRSDIEDLEFRADGVELSWQRTRVSEALVVEGALESKGLYPNFSWALGPYAEVALFDPDNPFRIDLGLRLSGRYEISPGLVFSGSVRKKIVGNLDSVTRLSDSVLPHVRSDYGLYDREGDPALETLTAEYFFRPGSDLYGRVTVGYLEKMYGGVSAEVLWKPVSSKLGFGAEINYAKQRDFDQLFGFQSYDIVTGHVSAYWDMGHGFYSQVDAGRYLAGDWGATFTVDRVFDNGWRVGGYFTLTDVSFEDFGEGSFDKGILLTIPLAWNTGKASRKTYDARIQPITRDGGARLDVENRLYGLVRDYHTVPLERQWGRFWR